MPQCELQEDGEADWTPSLIEGSKWLDPSLIGRSLPEYLGWNRGMAERVKKTTEIVYASRVDKMEISDANNPLELYSINCIRLACIRNTKKNKKLL